jgi:hypothetical protein
MADIILWLVLAILAKNRPARYGMVGLIAAMVTVIGYFILAALIAPQSSGGMPGNQTPFSLCSMPAGFFGLLGGFLGGFIGDRKFTSLRWGKYIFAGLGGMIASSIIILGVTGLK